MTITLQFAALFGFISSSLHAACWETGNRSKKSFECKHIELTVLKSASTWNNLKDCKKGQRFIAVCHFQTVVGLSLFVVRIRMTIKMNFAGGQEKGGILNHSIDMGGNNVKNRFPWNLDPSFWIDTFLYLIREFLVAKGTRWPLHDTNGRMSICHLLLVSCVSWFGGIHGELISNMLEIFAQMSRPGYFAQFNYVLLHQIISALICNICIALMMIKFEIHLRNLYQTLYSSTVWAPQ